MYYRILSKEIHEPDDLYVLVGFWDSSDDYNDAPDSPVFTQDWIMRNVPTVSIKRVGDDDQPLRTPEESPVDVGRYVRRHIERYLDRLGAKEESRLSRTVPERVKRERRKADDREILPKVDISEGTYGDILRPSRG